MDHRDTEFLKLHSKFTLKSLCFPCASVSLWLIVLATSKVTQTDMKIIRYSRDGATGYAQLREGVATRLRGEMFDFSPTDEVVENFQILAPLEPRALIGIGLNYRQHAIESGMALPQRPIVFFKNPAAVTGDGAPIPLPTQLVSQSVDYECELAVVIGRVCKNATRANALEFVAGYTGVNDVSARDWQLDADKGGGQWNRGKSFDGFCPLGPALVTPDEIADPNALQIRTILNGQTVQDSNTRDMIFDVPAIIEFLSADTTLLPGTVILTGTPAGVGMGRKPPVYLQDGDRVTVEIEGIGALSNVVEASASGGEAHS